MGQNFNSTEVSTGSIADGENQYKTPPYQRKYSWRKAEYTKLFDDIVESITNSEVSYYYIGTILLVRKSGEVNYEIVDGQQRLVTISLLYAAIYKSISDLINKIKKLNEIGRLEDSLFGGNKAILQDRQNDIKKFLLTNQGDIKIIPQEQFGNKDDFIKILNDLFTTSIKSRAKKNHGNRIICKVFDYFCKSIEGYAEDCSKNEHKKSNMKIIKEIDAVKNFLAGMKKISFVSLVAADYQNSYQLFETLNNRGKPLSAIDLIKNMICAELTDKEIKKNYQIWEGLVNDLLKENSTSTSEINADRYFRDFYNVFSVTNSIYKNVISTNKKLASKLNMISIYEEIMKKLSQKNVKVENLLKFLKKKSEIYNAIVYSHESKIADYMKNPKNKLRIAEYCSMIQNIKVVAVNAFLLYIFDKKSNENSNEFFETEKSFEEIVELMTKFSVRRIVTGFPRTNTLDKLMIDLIFFCEGECDKKRKLSKKLIEEKLIKEIKDLPKSEDFLFGSLKSLTESFFNLNAEDSKNFIKEVLTQLNNHNLNKIPKISGKIEHGFQEKIGHGFVIEHIMPQELTNEWRKSLSDFDDSRFKENQAQEKEKAKKIHDQWLHRMGNLTLIPASSNLKVSNKGLSIKQQEYRKYKTWLNYADCLVDGEKISAQYSKGKWNSIIIESRTKFLAEELAKFYQFKSEKSPKEK